MEDFHVFKVRFDIANITAKVGVIDNEGLF